MKPFWVTSLFGAASHQGIVELHYQDWSLQVDTETARQIAHDILAAAESADQDHFVHSFLTIHVGLEDSKVAQIFHEFREWRRRRAARPEAPHDPTDHGAVD